MKKTSHTTRCFFEPLARIELAHAVYDTAVLPLNQRGVAIEAIILSQNEAKCQWELLRTDELF